MSKEELAGVGPGTKSYPLRGVLLRTLLGLCQKTVEFSLRSWRLNIKAVLGRGSAAAVYSD